MTDRFRNWIDDCLDRLTRWLAKARTLERARQQRRHTREWLRQLRRRGVWFPGDDF
jgi:hypothetical protein